MEHGFVGGLHRVFTSPRLKDIQEAMRAQERQGKWVQMGSVWKFHWFHWYNGGLMGLKNQQKLWF